MAALVVVSVSPKKGLWPAERRIGIFPGGATPTMYTANAPFWRRRRRPRHLQSVPLVAVAAARDIQLARPDDRRAS
jgi:hypothetical protein